MASSHLTLTSYPIVDCVLTSTYLGEGIYNFGELLAHPILEAIKNTDKQWIVDLMYAFNAGDIAKFESSQDLLLQQVGHCTNHINILRQRCQL